MSNAAKHRKKAAEFEQLKQIDRAITSYVRAIEESEAAGEDVDVALFNKVGDLALRQGRVPDAITYYERAVEHYATSGLFNNAIALCNKILRNAPGRANVYFTLGRISARKGLRGDATRNFLEYATRMQQDGRIEEGIRALAEVADLMPELSDVRTMVDDLATRSGIELPRRRTPLRSDRQATPVDSVAIRDRKSQDLIFLDVDYGEATRRTPARSTRVPTPVAPPAVPPAPRTPTPAVESPLIDTAERVAVPVESPLAPLAAPVVQSPDSERPAPVLPEPTTDPLGLERPPAIDRRALVAPIEGLEANGEFSDEGGGARLDGFTPDEQISPAQIVDPSFHAKDVTWILPPEGELDAVHLDEVEIEDFDNAAADPSVAKAISTQTPPYVGVVFDEVVVDERPLEIERIDVEAVPELDEAIAAGQELVALAEAEASRAGTEQVPPMLLTPIVPMPMAPPPVPPVPLVAALAVDSDDVPEGPSASIVDALDAVEEQLTSTRPPFRLDPHDFILPGELPPLLLADAVVEAGLRGMLPQVELPRVPSRTPHGIDAVPAEPVVEPIGQRSAAPVSEATLPSSGGLHSGSEVNSVEDAVAELPENASGEGMDIPGMAGALPGAPVDAGTLAGDRSADRSDDLDIADGIADEEFTEGTDESLTPPTGRPVSVTPALPIAAVAEAATNVAASRRDALRAAVARMPRNWLLRRRLAEALFEAGERDAALAELETAQQGLVQDGEYAAASDIADELVHVSPDRVPYHQKRVELAVRAQDQQRLRFAYLDLADALVRMGEEGRARAVYARVLEIDPYDDRARAALGAAAPPPPPPAARPDDEFVDLADWLQDDGKPADTRMRMREPAISGDEQADFDALLRHFKEGVARSLGEDDFESHYDLGVAYKEMGLLDDAIAEFQKALRSRTHRLPAYEALGQCFVEQGRHQVAATVLSRALHEPGLDDDQRVGVLYLLAYSCEALQRRDEARSYYQRVYATDINFRDVAARLAALEQAPR